VHEVQHGFRLGLGGEEEAEGESRSAEPHDEAEALVSIGWAREEKMGYCFGDEA
jgi:hypothetical protein